MPRFHSLLLSEVSELNTPPSGHTAEGGWLDVPVFNRVGKQTDACVQVLLDTGSDGTEVVDSHTADFVGMEEDHLNRQRGFVFNQFIFCFVSKFYSNTTSQKGLQTHV